jgi:hypothetical protein
MIQKYAIEQRGKAKGGWKTYEVSNNSLKWIIDRMKNCRETWPQYEWRVCSMQEIRTPIKEQ